MTTKEKMTTKELIGLVKRSKGFDYSLEKGLTYNVEYLHVCYKGKLVFWASLEEYDDWFINGKNMVEMNPHGRHGLLNALKEYLLTPMDERGTVEREKRYYLKHRWLSDSYTYLHTDYYECYYWLDGVIDPEEKNTFTEKEIEHMKKELDTDLKTRYYDFLVYDRELTNDEMKAWELDFLWAEREDQK